MRPQPLISVTDVEASSRWYQRLLGCRSAHGGPHYEQLVFKGQLILQLHSFKVEHHHGPIGNQNDKPYGNGVLLWFEVEDFDSVMERASELGVEIVLPRHRNPPDGDGGPNHWECWMRDLDGYTVVVASPYGTADGDWHRPFPHATPLNRGTHRVGLGVILLRAVSVNRTIDFLAGGLVSSWRRHIAGRVELRKM